MDHAAALDLTRALPGDEGLDLRVHDDRTSIQVGVRSAGSGREEHEGVGATLIGEELALLARHRRDLSSQALDGSRNDRTLGRRKLSLEPKSATLVEVPPRHPPASFDVFGIGQRSSGLDVTSRTPGACGS